MYRDEERCSCHDDHTVCALHKFTAVAEKSVELEMARAVMSGRKTWDFSKIIAEMAAEQAAITAQLNA